ncbi:hypothetical protein Tco_0817448 [Tanacetum coccineum]
MFTDEHAFDYSSLPLYDDADDAHDYSSPPLWDDYDDNLFNHEIVNGDTYDDPFDFKEEKIKESKLLINELNLPESNNVLPFPECDSVFYEDFSEVDALSSTDNEDKVFNPGILIRENLEVNHQLLQLQIRMNSWIFEASRAHGFCSSITRGSILQLQFGKSECPNLIDKTFILKLLINAYDLQ